MFPCRLTFIALLLLVFVVSIEASKYGKLSMKAKTCHSNTTKSILKNKENKWRHEPFEFGRRHKGDFLIDRINDHHRYADLRNFRATVRFPEDEDFHSNIKISYVWIMIGSDNSLSEAYISDGGIDEPYIVIELSADATKNVGIDVRAYGYHHRHKIV